MTGTVLSTLLFLASLGLIFSEKLNRTIVAFAGAVLMVGLGMLFGFYSEAQAIAAIDFNTLGLLLGMMILVALLEPTGFFQYLAVWAGRYQVVNQYDCWYCWARLQRCYPCFWIT